MAAGKAAWPMAHACVAHRSSSGQALQHLLIAGPLPSDASRFSTEWAAAGRAAGAGSRVEYIDAPHPLPDERSERAGRRALALAAAVPDDGLLVVLLSGGASSMLAVPADGVTLGDKAAASAALMRAGVPIAGLNCVRKHLSAIKGGWLASAAGWRTLTLAISDVHAPVADDPAVIGSGPTAPDATGFAEALAIVDASGVEVPSRVRARLTAGARGDLAETPKPGGEGQAQATFEVIGNRRTAMEGAAAAAAACGYEAVLIDPPLGGEAREAGHLFARGAFDRVRASGRALCVIASGETVVTVMGDGRGGRNQEFALGALPVLESFAAAGTTATLGSAGTDGIDGPTDAAGAIVDATTPRRARAAGLDITSALRRNDAYPLLQALDALLVWGPTGTNVGDLHVLLTSPVARST